MTFSTASNQIAIRPQAALPVSWYGRAASHHLPRVLACAYRIYNLFEYEWMFAGL